MPGRRLQFRTAYARSRSSTAPTARKWFSAIAPELFGPPNQREAPRRRPKPFRFRSVKLKSSPMVGRGIDMGRAANRSVFFSLKKIFPYRLGPGHYLFAFVFLVRLAAMVRLASSPLLLPSGGDMQFYDEWAKQILRGHWTDHQAFYGLPLYPFLLALVYRLFGYGPFVPGLFQAGLDAGTAVLIYKITVEIMTR